MKLGILSDSHGRREPVEQALTLLNREGAEAFVHCGDVGGLDVVEAFVGRTAWFVWGNTDMPSPSWRAAFEAYGLPWPDGPLTIDLGGKRFGVFHGHEPEFRKAISINNGFDYVLHGHTHQQRDERIAHLRIINPGALHRATVKTVALLDIDPDELQFIEVD